jgi:hypothetical protein
MQQIRDVLAGSDKPLNSAQIASAVFGSMKPAYMEQVEQALLELIRSKSAFEHPPLKRGQRKRFWKGSPAAVTEAKILRLLAGKHRLTLRTVRDAIPTAYRGFFDEALGSLMRDKKVHPLTVGKTKYLLNRPPRPTEPLLRRHLVALKEIIERVNPHRKARLSVTDVVNFLDGSEIVFETGLTPHIPEELISSWYKKDLARLMGSKSVPILWTWTRYENWCLEQGAEASLSAFQDRLKQLAHVGKIELVPHGRSEPIDPVELPIAIKTDLGELLYYWKWLQEDTR